MEDKYVICFKMVNHKYNTSWIEYFSYIDYNVPVISSLHGLYEAKFFDSYDEAMNKYTRNKEWFDKLKGTSRKYEEHCTIEGMFIAKITFTNVQNIYGMEEDM